tara:strand:+ start:173 stop:829 length:657 start_codon:yes stop_codon:yes gene_type:complete
MIWIVDDFYPNPDEIRKKALRLKFIRGISTKDKGTPRAFHPGHRAIPNKQWWWENRIYLRNRWKDIANISVHEFESVKSNCSFNLGFEDKPNRLNWLHSDDGFEPNAQTHMYACVIYLTPNPPPNTGTLLLEGKDGSIYDMDRTIGRGYDKIFKGNYYDCKVSEFYKVHTRVENRYNRLIMYDARLLHAPTDGGFGKTKETARLTQLGFWYGENRLQI